MFKFLRNPYKEDSDGDKYEVELSNIAINKKLSNKGNVSIKTEQELVVS